LEEYKNTGYKSATLPAKALAEELDIEPMFKATTRIWRVKRKVGETACDEPITSPEKKFEVEFFNCLLDTTLISVNERFEQLNESWYFFFVQYKKDSGKTRPSQTLWWSSIEINCRL